MEVAFRCQERKLLSLFGVRALVDGVPPFPELAVARGFSLGLNLECALHVLVYFHKTIFLRQALLSDRLVLVKRNGIRVMAICRGIPASLVQGFNGIAHFPDFPVSQQDGALEQLRMLRGWLVFLFRPRFLRLRERL